ncbi:MAG: SPW repeat protein [Thermomicrobium sp.]|nr:SPW repeat protein [Thermomicrobium sp.]MDW8058830.1 SPW repeat protein [Thermomicrobium sp.]
MATAQRRSSALWDYVAALVMVLGLWIAASPYVIPDAWLYDVTRLSATFFGGCIVMFAIAELALSPGLRWVGLANVPIGIWIAAAPFVSGETAVSGMVVSCVVAGLAVALLSLASVIFARR